MSSKTWLVAQREYLENLRTKTFWIGIIFIPILIALSIAVPAWLEKTKDPRKYSVIDRSGWLMQAIEERAAMPDLRLVFRQALRDLEDDPTKFATYPPALQEFARVFSVADQELANAPEEDIEAAKAALRQAGMDHVKLDREFLVSSMAEAIASIGEAPPIDVIESFVPKAGEAMKELIDLRDQIRDWWQALPPEEAEVFGRQMSKAEFEYVPLPEGADEAEIIEKLNADVGKERLFAYVIIPEEPIDAEPEEFRYVSKNLTDRDLKTDYFDRFATDVIRKRRIAEEGIDPLAAKRIQESVTFDTKKLSATGEEEKVSKQDTVKQFAPVAFVYLLWLAVFSITQMLLTNTIEEKSNRILEVLLSSVSPIQLMIGKIWGIAMTGLTVVSSWVLCFVVMVKYVPKMVGGGSGVDLTEIASDPVFLASFLSYFFLGYLLFASLLVGIGSVCNSIKEANNLMMPITVVLMVPLLAMIPISKDPNGSLAVFLSYVPPFTPFVMMNRAAGPPAAWEYAVTTVLLLVSIAGAMWAAAKIFRIGILMTGKAPTPMEILRWLKAPVGQVPVRKE